MTSRDHESTSPAGTEGTPIVNTTTPRPLTPLTRMQKFIVGLAIAPMIAVGVMGGIGTYSNISRAYGSGTAIGALAAGEGATAVLALLLLGLTMLGQSSPAVIRVGLWALPAAAATMGATAATSTGQTIVYALTPMAITASAEGLAFLVRRIVVHQVGRDVEVEARAAALIRDLAYHQARAAAHPSERAKKRSVRKSWRLARKVGKGDVALGGQLLDVQRSRLVQGADSALERMFTPGLTSSPLELSPASAPVLPTILPASADDVMSPRGQESTIPADADGYPADTAADQDENTQDVRPDVGDVRDQKAKKPSIAADVRQMVRDGVLDVRHVVDAIATRHQRSADDPKLSNTVARYFREARAALETEQRTSGQYL